MRIAVVGSGISGTLASLRLAHQSPGVEVLLFGDLNRKLSGTSAAAVMLNSIAEVDTGVSPGSRHWEKLLHSRLADRMWDEVPDFLAGITQSRDRGLSISRGTFVLDSGIPHSLERKTFEAIVSVARRLGERVEASALESIAGYLPTHEGRASQAIFLDREGWLDPNQFLPTFDQALRASTAVQSVTEDIEEIVETNSGVRLKSFAGNFWEADRVLLANGWGAGRFLEQFGLVKGKHNALYAGEGTTVRLRPTENSQEYVIRTPNRGLACGLYSAPHGNELVVGATSHVVEKPEGVADVESIRSLTSMATSELNRRLSTAGLIAINHGVRPVTTDGFPMVGWLSDKVFLLSGTRRDGWHFAPLWTEVAADALVGERESDIQLSHYDPHREIVRELNVEDAVQNGTEHYLSGMVQHGFVGPGGAYPDQIAENYRLYFRELHNYFGLEFGLPVDLLGVASRRRQAGDVNSTF